MQMPFEDVLPYPEFAVRLREHALFRLPALLDDISAIDGLVGALPHLLLVVVTAAAVRKHASVKPGLERSRPSVYDVCLHLAGRAGAPIDRHVRPAGNSSTGIMLCGKMQVERMQRNVDCVWKYFTWRDPEARALDALMCSLARKLTSGRITPVMDWEACALTCDA